MRKTPVVMGVLAIIFGSIQVLMTGVGLASAPFSKQMMGSMGKGVQAFKKGLREPPEIDVTPSDESAADAKKKGS